MQHLGPQAEPSTMLGCLDPNNPLCRLDLGLLVLLFFHFLTWN